VSRLDAIGRRATWLAATRGRLAAVWAAATLVSLASLAAAPGISRDEAAVLASIAGVEPAAVATPPLAPDLAAGTHAVLSRAGFSHVRAARLGTAVAGALLAALLALLGWDLAGRAGALLAPALFWLAPRHLQAGLSAAPDLALASLWVAVTVSYRRAAAAASRSRATGPALVAGLLFGAALAARPDSWILLPALAIHAAAAGPLRPSEAAARTSGAPWAVAAMLVVGPAVLLVAWGAPWRAHLRDVVAAFAPGAGAAWSELGTAAPGGPMAPLAVTALALPATLLFTYVSGLVHAAARLFRALRGHGAPPLAAEELLLLLLAAAPLAAAAARVAPPLGGVRAWLPAMPFLALLGARALVAAARTAWPSKAAPLAAALALLVLYPALRAMVRTYPAGASTWNELAGGAPGAASLGMRRQDGGEAAAALLPMVAARARPGARLWWAGVAPAAVRLYASDGRLRPDLVAAVSPDAADLAVVTLDGGSRDAEYRVWSAFRTARPAAGAYLDEVPLAFVYARPGAWR
jgi:hypothetical protein